MYRWAIDLYIKGFFDNINHELLMKAVERFTQEKWILLKNDNLPDQKKKYA